MAETARTIFRITSWNEETISELDEGARMTHVRVTKAYDGKFTGEGAVDYLMVHRADGSANFVGYETVTGVLDELAGSLVFEHTGTFKEGTVDSTWSIVDGSGTGELRGIRGNVAFSAGHQEEYEISLSYDL